MFVNHGNLRKSRIKFKALLQLVKNFDEVNKNYSVGVRIGSEVGETASHRTAGNFFFHV